MTQLVELENQIQELRTKLIPLQKKRDRITEAAEAQTAKSMIGNCYKYHNTYGSSSGYWWMYSKIVGAKGTMVKVVDIQKDSHGEIDLKFKTTWTNHFRHEWRPITNKQFERAYNHLMKQVQKQVQVKKS